MTDHDDLADRMIAMATLLARKGAMVTWRVAFGATIITGGAYLLGLAAFGGGVRSFWATVGLVLLALGVGAPLLATFRLQAIPKKSAAMRDELRTLLAGESESRRVVIDVIESEPTESGQLSPVFFGEYHRFARLRTIPGTESGTLAGVVRVIASLPALLAITLLVTTFSGFLGFIFLLIWIF